MLGESPCISLSGNKKISCPFVRTSSPRCHITRTALHIIILNFINACIMYKRVPTPPTVALYLLLYINLNTCTQIIHIINGCVCVCVRVCALSHIRGAKYLTPSVYTRGGCAVNVKGTRMAVGP